MKRFFCLSFIFLLAFGSLLAKESESKELTVLSSARSKFRLQLKEAIESTFLNSEDITGQIAGIKSVKKSVLFSAIVPGSGQIYANSYIKGLLFLGVEITAIAMNESYNKSANDFEDEYEALADAQWDEDQYWNWIWEIAPQVEPGIDLNRNNLDELREFERRTFSHFLPYVKNQQYYENVGKYNQFVYGWADFRNFERAALSREDVPGEPFNFNDYKSSSYDSQNLGTISETRSNYVKIRKDSNDNFKKATTMSTIILFNHVVSAIDAGLTTKFRNDKVTAELNMQGRLYNEELVPVLALGVHW